MKCDDIPNVDHFAVENIRFVIKLNMSNIAFVFHHGLIPASNICPTQEASLKAETDRLSLEDINAEVSAARQERAQ